MAHSGGMEPRPLYLCRARADTFQRWPFHPGCACNARAMAEAGFFSVAPPQATPEEADSARCFLCGKELDGWEETDDPREEHRSHARHCAFMQLDKQEDELLTVEFLSIVKQYMINEVKRLADASKEALDEKVRRVTRKCFRNK